MRDYLYQMEPVFDEAEATAVAECIRSGWVTEAKTTDAFERAIADYAGATYAVAVPSCTTAMALSLMALGVGHGDEVIVPDLTFVATANAVSLAGGTAVLVDLDPDTWGLDVCKMRQAITPKTKAILPVWLNGHDPGMRQIVAAANEYGIPVVEDAACGLGSFSAGQHAGTFGKLGCFSFNTTKIITTGCGGMVVTNDADLYEKVERLKNHGRLDRRDVHPSVGFNFYFTDLLASLGMAQMEKLAERVEWKHQLCHWYCDRLEDLEGVQIKRPDDGICPWYPDLFVDDRGDLKQYLEEHKIQSRTYYPAIHTQPSYACEGEFEVATSVGRRGLWLPAASYVDEATVDLVCEHIRDWVNR